MATLRKNAIPVLYIFFLSMFFQNCKVYQNKTITIEEAASTKDLRYKKVKTYDGKVYHLRRIEIIEGKLYGSKYKSGGMKPLRAGVGEVISVRAQNKVASIGTTSVIILGAGAAIALAVFIVTFDLE